MDSRVPSLILSVHIFIGLPRLVFLSTEPCNNSLELLLYLEMCPYYESFIFFIILYCSGPGLSMTVYHTMDVVSGDVSIL